MRLCRPGIQKYWLLVTAIALSFVMAWPLESQAGDQAITSYILGLNHLRSLRHQPNAPIPSAENIAAALDGDLVVKKADLNDQGLRYLWVATVLKVDAAKWWMTLIDREDYELISKNILESFVVQRFSDSFLNYNVLKAPLISARHQVLMAKVNVPLFNASRGRMWEHYWHLVTDVPQQIKKALQMNKLHDMTREDLEDAVVVKHNSGSWMVIPLPDGRVWVDSYTVNDPGGSIPGWIVRRVAGIATKGTFKQYETWVREKLDKHFAKPHGELLAPDGTYKSPKAMRVFLEALPGAYADAVSDTHP